MAAKSSAFTMFWPGKTSGRPGSSSWSFANATMLPENEIEPMSAENMIPMTTSPARSPGSGASRWNSAAAMSAAAPPPTPLKSATICGIAVMRTIRADATPITVPTAMPAKISP